MKSFPLSEGHLPGLECHEHGEPSVSKASRVPLALKIKRPVPSDQQTRDSAGTAKDGNSGQRDAWWDKHPERVQHVPGGSVACSREQEAGRGAFGREARARKACGHGDGFSSVTRAGSQWP